MEFRFQDLPIATETPVSELGIGKVFKYLAARGIKTAKQREELGLRVLPAKDIGKKGDERAAVVFPHFDAQGNPLDWWSARLVDVMPPTAWDLQLGTKGRGKMYCPPKERPSAYLVPTLDWREMGFEDTIFIHESAIKAYAGARCGFWSIGLNGVWGWTSKKHEMALVPEIKDLPWAYKKLKCVIVFDSNVENNDDVRAAMVRLTAKMQEICKVECRWLPLPKPPKEFGQADWGFDDYCVFYGDDKGKEFLSGAEANSVPVDISQMEQLKLQLNNEVCVVTSMGRIAEQDNPSVLMTRDVFLNVNYAHYTVPMEDDKGKITIASAPLTWLKWGGRTVVKRLEYMPGEERIANAALNTWRGMGVEPAHGDVQKWLDNFERNVPDKNIRHWMLCWMAWPLQHPGAKLHSYIHLWGPPGSGKQALFYPLMRIYGDSNSAVIGEEQLRSDFNSVYSSKQLINIDELEPARAETKDKINRKLKSLTTDPQMVVNTKGVPEYKLANLANIFSTSNYIDSIKLDDDDRRCLVIKYGDRLHNRREDGYWDEYYAWMDGDGASAVYDYLLRYDCKGFDPKGWAPMTEEKAAMTESTKTVLEQWVDALWTNPDMLPAIVGKRALLSSKELAQYAFADDPMGVTPGKTNQLGIRMHSAGFKSIKLKVDGLPTKFWIVRGKDEAWTPASAQAHLKTFKAAGGKF